MSHPPKENADGGMREKGTDGVNACPHAQVVPSTGTCMDCGAPNADGVKANVISALHAALARLVESHGYTSYLSHEEKEADPDVKAARAAIAQVVAAGVAPPDELKQAMRSGFMFGWKAAAVWAERTDLIADIGSPAYEKDCDAARGVEGEKS